MVTLPEEYIGSICEVKSADNQLLASARLAKVGEGLVELVPAEKGDSLPFLPYQESVRINVINTRIGFRMVTGKVFISTSGLMRVTSLGEVQNSERRGYFRMQVRGTGKLYPPGIQEHQLAGQTPLNVTLEDVSLSGVQISTTVKLKEDEAFTLEFRLLRGHLLLGVRVKRLSKIVDNVYHYGLAFVNLTDRESDMLCRDIFELQRQENARRKGTV